MYVRYFDDGYTIYVRGELVDGKQEGLWEEYYEHPYMMKLMNRFRNGLLDGTQMSWHPNGHIQGVTNYKDGHLHGEAMIYDITRTLIFHAQYENGTCTKIEVNTLPDE